ncbi:MAG: type II/IV secretion system protein, partial [Fibrobacteres bacterium]|nr:type II/IV secretion system protein [Fibrobacterota bacterium]
MSKIKIFQFQTVKEVHNNNQHVCSSKSNEMRRKESVFVDFYFVKEQRFITGKNANINSLTTTHNQNSIEHPRTTQHEKSSTVTLVSNLISHAIKNGASDIHFEPFETELKVRYRIDGLLQEGKPIPNIRKPEVLSRLKIMAQLDIAEKRRPQDGKIRFDYEGRGIDIRVSTMPTGYGEKIVLRILDKSSVSLQMSSLGMEQTKLKSFESAVSRPYGMILVTGPTGSGKTTTLYAALNKVKSPQVNISTVEDPIEYNIEGINQTQVKPEIGLTFSTALRTLLRQDPNIIMVGEIRDRDTADIAVRAALTGHLVMSTLHTNDAPSAIVRLQDMGIEPFLITSTIHQIVAQRLVRRICENCKVEIPVDSTVAEKLSIVGSVFHGMGCQMCGNTGYKGRIG